MIGGGRCFGGDLGVIVEAGGTRVGARGCNICVGFGDKDCVGGGDGMGLGDDGGRVEDCRGCWLACGGEECGD